MEVETSRKLVHIATEVFVYKMMKGTMTGPLQQYPKTIEPAGMKHFLGGLLYRVINGLICSIKVNATSGIISVYSSTLLGVGNQFVNDLVHNTIIRNLPLLVLRLCF